MSEYKKTALVLGASGFIGSQMVKKGYWVRVCNLNNDLIHEKLGRDYSQSLEEGINNTYNWIVEQIKK
jgi:nucleoside-diphosphate-sugar epimerase